MKPLIARHEVAPVHQQIRLEHGNNDYIGSMPLKLLLQIAEYLDPADIVRCQRVRIVHSPTSYSNWKASHRPNKPELRL